VLSAWTLQALVADHDVTVLAGDAPSIEELNRYAGTNLAAGAFRVVRISALFRALERV